MSALKTSSWPLALATAVLLALMAAVPLLTPAVQAQTMSTVTATALRDAQIRVEWTPVAGVTAYNVRLTNGAGTSGIRDVQVSDAASGYTSRSLLPNAEYRVAVFDASTNPGNPSEVGSATVTTTARLAPSRVPQARRIDVSDQEIAVAWLPAPRGDYYEVQHRRHDEEFDDNTTVVLGYESLHYFAGVGTGNENTAYYVRITPKRREASDGPAFIQSAGTMASGQSNPWDALTFDGNQPSQNEACRKEEDFPLALSDVYRSSSRLQKYIDNCVIDIGSRSSGTLRSDSYFGSAPLLDVHDARTDIRQDAWFDGKTIQFQHPFTVMALRVKNANRVYGVSRGMRASVDGRSVNLLRCIQTPSETNISRSGCVLDIAGSTAELVITPAGTGRITVAVNGTDVDGDVSGSLAAGLTLPLPQETTGDIITIDMPSVTVANKRYVFRLKLNPPQPDNAPGQVTGVSATPGGTSSTVVSWDQLANVDRYVVEYSTDSTFSSVSTVNVRKQGGNPPATSRTITGLSESTTYYVRVYAVNDNVNGLRSDTKSVTTSTTPTPPPEPPAPANLAIAQPAQANDLHDPDKRTSAKRAARRATLKTLKVNWDAVSVASGDVTYKVQWRTGGESFNDESSHTLGVTEYDITTLQRNTLYYVQVAAIVTDNGLSTTGAAASDSARTRRASYACANVDGSIQVTGSIPGNIDLLAKTDNMLTLPSYTGPVCFLDIYVKNSVLRRADFTGDTAPANNELGPRQSGARDIQTRLGTTEYDVPTQVLTLKPNTTRVSSGYQDVTMSVAWSSMDWSGHVAQRADVRVHNLAQLTIGASGSDFTLSEESGTATIQGGIDRSYQQGITPYNSGGYEVDACNVTNGDCGNDSWTQIHESTRAQGADGRIEVSYTLPNSDNAYRFRVREYLDLRHNSEVAYSEWSAAARVN